MRESLKLCSSRLSKRPNIPKFVLSRRREKLKSKLKWKSKFLKPRKKKRKNLNHPKLSLPLS